jgi:hypothetical protein
VKELVVRGWQCNTVPRGLGQLVILSVQTWEPGSKNRLGVICLSSQEGKKDLSAIRFSGALMGLKGYKYGVDFGKLLWVVDRERPSFLVFAVGEQDAQTSYRGGFAQPLTPDLKRRMGVIFLPLVQIVSVEDQ